MTTLAVYPEMSLIYSSGDGRVASTFIVAVGAERSCWVYRHGVWAC